MRLTTRVARLEAKARAGPAPLVLVILGLDGNWNDGRGVPIPPEAVPPGARVVVIGERPDGPQ